MKVYLFTRMSVMLRLLLYYKVTTDNMPVIQISFPKKT